MNIIIHGTKGGYRVLYATPNSPLLAGDSRSATSNESAVGQSAYSIAFAANGCVFTKFVIIRDIMRSMATGNIAFSVYIPNNQKISGTDVKSLLDQLSNHYCKNYTYSSNLDNVREDWSFVEDIARTFKIKDVPADDVENIQQGVKDAAFVYYFSDEELQKYFDVFYHYEYSAYRQVFLVDKKLEKIKENPLFALRHDPNANLTGKILENPSYKLREYQGRGESGISIEIRANDIIRNNKDRIFKNDNINIKYSKDCYRDIYLKGKLTDTTIAQYLIIDESSKKIDVKKNVELQPKIKLISFEFLDYKENIVTDLKIQLIIQPQPQNEVELRKSKTIVKFQGEEIVNYYTISASAERDGILYSGKEKFIPVNIDRDTFEVRIHKEKTVKIIPQYEGNIKNCNIRINSRKYTKSLPMITSEDNLPKIIFKDKQIEDKWKIEVSRKDRYDNYYYGKIEDFYPEKEKITRKIEMEKKSPIYNKLNIKTIIFGLIVIAIILTAFIWIKYKKNNDTELQIKEYVEIEKQIKEYVEGDSLFIDRLNNHKKDWKTQKPEIEIKSKFVWYKATTWLGNNEEQTDSIQWKEWEKTSISIDSAIIKRKYIDSHDFEELKKLNYSQQQECFENIIREIDPIQYKSFKEQLSDISNFTLNQIAQKIDSIVENNTEKDERKID
jgi:hypothetical protein